MNTKALLRTTRSGKSFDLKFYNPAPDLHRIITEYLTAKQQNFLFNNYSHRKDDNLMAIGFEARTETRIQSKKLAIAVKDFCEENKIEFTIEMMPGITGDAAFGAAASHRLT